MTDKTDALVALAEKWRTQADNTPEMPEWAAAKREDADEIEALAAPAEGGQPAASVDVEGLRTRLEKMLSRVLREHDDMPNSYLEGWEKGLREALRLIDSAGGAKGEDDARKLYEPDEYADAFNGRTPQPAEGDGAVAVVVANTCGIELVWANPPSVARPPVGTKLYTRPAATAVVPRPSDDELWDQTLR